VYNFYYYLRINPHILLEQACETEEVISISFVNSKYFCAKDYKDYIDLNNLQAIFLQQSRRVLVRSGLFAIDKNCPADY